MTFWNVANFSVNLSIFFFCETECVVRNALLIPWGIVGITPAPARTLGGWGGGEEVKERKRSVPCVSMTFSRNVMQKCSIYYILISRNFIKWQKWHVLVGNKCSKQLHGLPVIKKRKYINSISWNIGELIRILQYCSIFHIRIYHVCSSSDVAVAPDSMSLISRSTLPCQYIHTWTLRVYCNWWCVSRLLSTCSAW